MLKGTDGLFNKSSGQIDPAMLAKLVDRSINAASLAAPLASAADQRIQTMDIALALANILKNPTEDQKLILDSIISLLSDTNKNKENDSQSPELKKAQDDLLQMVANVLIAQAIPDLLKEGDVAGIKNIFKDLDTEKSKLIVDYNESIKPYYSEIKKLLSRNLAMLQLNNIVSKTMLQEEISKMEPNEIDRIIGKIKKMQNTSFEANYIVQEEAKLHSKFIDPNKKAFEDRMKAMLEGFTQRLSKILETTKK
jgi:hypothetical protein